MTASVAGRGTRHRAPRPPRPGAAIEPGRGASPRPPADGGYRSERGGSGHGPPGGRAGRGALTGQGSQSARALRWEAAREAVIRAEGRHDSLVERDLDLAAEADRATRELAELTAEEPITGESSSASPADPLRDGASAAQQRWHEAAERAREADGELLAAEEALATVRRRGADRLAETGQEPSALRLPSARRERLGAGADRG